MQQYIEVVKNSYTKFIAANSSCKSIIEKCNDRKVYAGYKKFGAGFGGTAVVAGSVLSLAAGFFTLGTGTIVGLAVTGDAASASSLYFNKVEESFRNLSNELSVKMGALDVHILQINENFKRLDGLLFLLRNELTKKGDIPAEFDCEQFDKSFQFGLDAANKGLMACNKLVVDEL